MPDKAGSGDFRLQYDTEGNLIAKLEQAPDGTWILVPEPDYPMVLEVETGLVGMWDRKNRKTVKFAPDTPGKLEQDQIL